MRSEAASAGSAAIRRWAHPWTPVLLVGGLTAGTVPLVLGGSHAAASTGVPMVPWVLVLPWVLMALSAGYAVSGSV